MSSFKITMKDNSHEGVYQLEAAIRNAKDWTKFWQDKNNIKQYQRDNPEVMVTSR